MTKLNLGQAFDLFKIQEAFLNAEPGFLGDCFRQCVQQHRTKEGIKMVKDQIKGGHLATIELTIGCSTVELINRIF